MKFKKKGKHKDCEKNHKFDFFKAQSFFGENT